MPHAIITRPQLRRKFTACDLFSHFLSEETSLHFPTYRVHKIPNHATHALFYQNRITQETHLSGHTAKVMSRDKIDITYWSHEQQQHS